VLDIAWCYVHLTSLPWEIIGHNGGIVYSIVSLVIGLLGLVVTRLYWNWMKFSLPLVLTILLLHRCIDSVEHNWLTFFLDFLSATFCTFFIFFLERFFLHLGFEVPWRSIRPRGCFPGCCQTLLRILLRINKCNASVTSAQRFDSTEW